MIIIAYENFLGVEIIGKRNFTDVKLGYVR
jgi:hypothetical protein